MKTRINPLAPAGGAGVSSITGTANQITASAATGAVVLSLPSALTGIASITPPVSFTVDGQIITTAGIQTLGGTNINFNGFFRVAGAGYIYAPTDGHFEFYQENLAFGDIKLRNLTPTGGNGLAVFTVATLPATAATGLFQGSRVMVTDSNAVSYTAGIGSVVAGTGTTVVPVVYDGSAWRIG